MTADDHGEWQVMDDDGFLGLVGPIMWRTEQGKPVFAFRAQGKHRNLRSVVQGGMLMTFADRAMGSTVRFRMGSGPIATVQLDVHFVEPARIGELVIARAGIVRATASIIFVDAQLTVDGRLVANAKGIWKRLRPAV